MTSPQRRAGVLAVGRCVDSFGLAIGIGFALLIIPSLIALVIWRVVAPVTVLERPGVFAAFRRSRELVRGNGWNVSGVIVNVFIAVIVVIAAAGVVAARSDGSDGQSCNGH